MTNTVIMQLSPRRWVVARLKPDTSYVFEPITKPFTSLETANLARLHILTNNPKVENQAYGAYRTLR